MFDQSFSFILTIAALVVGFMLFTGHGSIFMKGGNTQARNQKYDEKKMEKASGVDAFTTSVAAKIAYVVILFVILAVFLFVLRTKCIKK
jgi:Na+/H+ antiporter NhaC